MTFKEFKLYFNELQKKMIESAQAPVIEMTRKMMEDQKRELAKETEALLRKNQELKERIKTDEAARTELEDNEKKLSKISSEFSLKAKLVETALHEEKKRSKASLANRLAKKKSQHSVRNLTD